VHARDRVPECADLAGYEHARGPGRQLPQTERPDGDSLQLLGAMADRLAQPADEMMPPFMNGDPQPGLRRQTALDRDLGGRRRAVIETDAALQTRERARVGSPAHLDAIDARDVMTRMHEPLGELAVVGEEHEPRRSHVEAADGKHTRQAAWQQGADREATLGIAERRHDAGGLVHDDVHRFAADREWLAVDGDAISAPGAGPELRDGPTVQLDPALANQRLRGPPRADPGLRQELL